MCVGNPDATLRHLFYLLLNNMAKVKLPLPGLTKKAYHTIFIYEKNACHILSYNFIE